jgi:hypothetical protein
LLQEAVVDPAHTIMAIVILTMEVLVVQLRDKMDSVVVRIPHPIVVKVEHKLRVELGPQVTLRVP